MPFGCTYVLRGSHTKQMHKEASWDALGCDQISALRGDEFNVLNLKIGLGPCRAQCHAEQFHAGASFAPPSKLHQLHHAVKEVELILG